MRTGESASQAEPSIRRTTDESEAFRELIVHLDRELAIRDGDEHAFYAPFNQLDRLALAGVVVAYIDDEAVGCGAFKRHNDTTVEIKRMFVFEHCRGRRIATGILNELEKWASEKGFSSAVLETGHRQPEAIALYRRCGYDVIPNYGHYSDMLNSVCMKKVF